MFAMSFNINALYCGVEKGKYENRESLSISPLGINEDYHKDSEILMLDIDSYTAIVAQKDKARCMSKFYAHIIINHPNKCDLSVGDVMSNGRLKLSIIKIGKDCHIQDGCEYALQNKVCPLNHKTYYLESLNVGDIRINEQWEVIKCIDMP